MRERGLERKKKEGLNSILNRGRGGRRGREEEETREKSEEDLGREERERGGER